MKSECETAKMSEAQKEFLLDSARRYIWWETANTAMSNPKKVLAQIMNIGVWNDICKLVELFSEQDLLDVLDTAEIGQFNERSWHFWHNRMSVEIPPIPRRILS